MKAGDWNWYKFLTLVVSGIASIAAVATAIVSWKTMDINDSMYDKIKVLQKESMIHESALSNALDRVNLYGDIIAAEGGDRWAYKRAKEWICAHYEGDIESEPMIQTLDFTVNRFQGEATNNSFIVNNAINLPPLFYDGANVAANLKSTDIYKRLNALGAIWALRLNKYIPDAIDIAKNEPNLHVLQLLVFVVEETFTDNLIINDTTPVYSLSFDDCVFRYEEFKQHFMEMWNSAKPRILARKPKEVREGRDKNPPHLPMVYLFDPEKPDNIPVIKK